MTQQKRVLLVDDEVSIQRSLSSLLRSRATRLTLRRAASLH
jgi:CheY-like chemotaxis protein